MKQFKSFKKVLSILLALSLISLLTACSGQSNKDTSSDVNTETIDNSSAKIAVMTQEYQGDNIAEILMISYDADQPDLEKSGGKNPEIESFNNAIGSGVQQSYDDFMKNVDSKYWIEIRSYPFTSEDYLQIVTTCSVYPTYGTDGDLYSYNFNLKENRFVSIDDTLNELQLDRDSITNTVRGLVEEDYKDGTTTGAVEVAGFLITKGASGPLTQLLLQVDITPPDADLWSQFYSYTPELSELVQLNSKCLFDPSDMDQMNPPLSYETEILPVSDMPFAFDAEALEMIIPGYDYMLNGIVHFTVEELSPVSYSEDAVLDKIKSLEPEQISLTTISESEEHSALLNSPSWLVVYDEGINEDLLQCIDIYVQTETADYRLHTSVPEEYALDYHDEIGRRLATVYWAG